MVQKKHSKTEIAHRTVRNCISDLIEDLKLDHIEKSEKLQSLVENKKKSVIFSELKDSNSELYKAIPKILLESDQSGKKYLDVLGIFQPELLVSDIPKNLKDLLLSPDNSELMSLANEVFSNTDLTQELQGLQEMNFSSIMNVMSNVSNIVAMKKESGEINMEELSNQALNLFSQIQDTSEVKSVLQTNPELSNLLNTLSNVQNNNTDQPPDLMSNLMSNPLLNTMLSSMTQGNSSSGGVVNPLDLLSLISSQTNTRI